MPVDNYKVYEYKCDFPGCTSNPRIVEDRGGRTGQHPVGIFCGTVTFNLDKGFQRVNWVACQFDHIAGAQEHMLKESLGKNK